MAARSRSRSPPPPSATPCALAGVAIPRRCFLRLTLGDHAHRVPAPLPLRGCEHWQGPLFKSLETARMKLPLEPCRRFRCESFCTGTGAEIVGLESMGVDADFLAAADIKASAQLFLKHNFAKKLRHIYKDMSCYEEGYGECVLHGRVCAVPDEQADLAIGGLPCQGFSNFRQKNGGAARTSDPHHHPTFPVVTQEFNKYLQRRQPATFIIEEVCAFAQTDRRTGQTFLHEVAAQCLRQGYCVRVLELCHGLWTELERKRLWILGFSHASGHAQGADYCVRLLEESNAYRRLTPPTPIWEIIDSEGAEEEMRREQMASRATPAETARGGTAFLPISVVCWRLFVA